MLTPLDKTIFLTIIEDVLEKELPKNTVILSGIPKVLKNGQETHINQDQPDKPVEVETTTQHEVDTKQPEVVPLSLSTSNWFTLDDSKYNRMKKAEFIGEYFATALNQARQMAEDSGYPPLRTVRTRCILEDKPPPEDRKPWIEYPKEDCYRIILRTAFEHD